MDEEDLKKQSGDSQSSISSPNLFLNTLQPKQNKINTIPDLHEIGCLGKITNFKDSTDGKYSVAACGHENNQGTCEFLQAEGCKTSNGPTSRLHMYIYTHIYV